ncbi:TPA: hypothetical protein ACXOGI_002601 [Pseudomonas aeruginosa]|nr:MULTISPECIES: hypothetical protein [Pseudomonas]EIU7151767.1 hypothetical protein [Pseudomonas aeruginosa]EIU7188124.1 hypothetical protein [Pseudomonas aeruginosa]ELK4819378.1 hypothetical protein [Pseudomonas aeruginosa]ELK4890038.1 hypothetical protein [Pseudomonas aeruginosa]ELK4895061.1 hypothetical protein [Pseudomonas aeruginosa]
MKIESEKFNSIRKSLIKLIPKQKAFLQSLELIYSFQEGSTNQHKHTLSHTDSEGNKTEIITISTNTPHVEPYAIELARYAFLYLVADLLSYRDLASYFLQSISALYKHFSIEGKEDHTIIKYSSIKFDTTSGIFATTLKENSLIFFSDDFDVDNFSYKPDHIGNITYFCKTHKTSFNRYNLISALSIPPAFTHSDFIYKKALGVKKTSTILNIIETLNPGEDSTPYLLKKRLIETPLSDGLAFESICEEILAYIFSSAYDNLKLRKQVPTHQGVRRRDFIIDNISPKHPWLADLRKSGVKYILFDAKNYEKPLATNDLDTFFSYIQEQPRFGSFGIIISRKGVKENAKTHILYRMLSKHDEIIVLDENDLIRLIDLLAIGHDPISLLSEKLSELHLKC